MRLLDFSDGYESAAAPDQGVILTGGFGSYASDAAFVTALTAQGGTLGAGNAYFNSVSGRLRTYDGTIWQNVPVSIDPNFVVPVYASDATFLAALTAAGGSLAAGARYWNSTSGELRVYNGSAYVRVANLVGGVFRVRIYATEAAFASDLSAQGGGSPTAGSAFWDSTLGVLKIYDGSSWIQALLASQAQVITNKDIDGGTASNARRITVPKDTLTNLTALSRKEGTLVFDTVSKSLYLDDGTSLTAVLGAAVSSVNGFAGVVVLDTDDIAEGATNLYFTDARAKSAAVADSITNGVTDVAPSQNAVFDALALKEDTANKGVASGYASLDGSGKVPIAQIPDTVVGAVDYIGTWNANTNTPDLPAATPDKGDYYVVSVAGTTSLGGITDWQVGDWAIYNGTIWQKVDNTDQVSSVNGFTGTVVLDTDDVSEGATNLYFTDARAKSAAVADTITNGVTDVAPSQNAVYDALALKYDKGSVVSVAGTHNIAAGERYLLVDTSAARTLNLPTPAVMDFYIKDVTGTANTNNISLVPNGGEKIEGLAATRLLAAAYGSWHVFCDGTDWYFI